MTSRGTASAATPVETYVAQLGRALTGPRRRKADLLAEAADSLVDATEAFEARGLSRQDAELRAVQDFGELAEVVAGYRSELGFAQGRRTAFLLTMVMLAQPLIWQEGAWQWNRADVGTPGPFEAVLNRSIELAGMATIVGAVLAVLACGIGVRFPAVRNQIARVTAVFTLLSCAVIGGIAIGLGLVSPLSAGPAIGGLFWVFLFVLGPLSFVGYSAGRCLRLA